MSGMVDYPSCARYLAIAFDIVTDWTAIVGPITTLLGGLGGYWLAGRNDDKRDRRAAVRESTARRDSLAERLEEDRHIFQRDTLLELQDELQQLVRNTAQISLQDQRTIKAEGQMYLLDGDLSEENMRLRVSVHRLRSRVLDDQLRTEVGKFTTFCAISGMPLAEYREGKVPDDQRDEAIARMQAQIVQIANTYGELSESLGVHLRRELDRRFLTVPNDDDERSRA
jgi:hypothetical protein